MIGNEVSPVLNQFALRCLRHKVSDPLIVGESEREPAHELNARMDAFEEDANLKELVDPFFLHSAPIFVSWPNVRANGTVPDLP